MTENIRFYERPALLDDSRRGGGGRNREDGEVGSGSEFIVSIFLPRGNLPPPCGARGRATPKPGGIMEWLAVRWRKIIHPGPMAGMGWYGVTRRMEFVVGQNGIRFGRK